MNHGGQSGWERSWSCNPKCKLQGYLPSCSIKPSTPVGQKGPLHLSPPQAGGWGAHPVCLLVVLQGTAWGPWLPMLTSACLNAAGREDGIHHEDHSPSFPRDQAPETPISGGQRGRPFLHMAPVLGTLRPPLSFEPPYPGGRSELTLLPIQIPQYLLETKREVPQCPPHSQKLFQ